MPCNHCPLRDTCKSPCQTLEALLPDPDAGRVHALHRKDAWAYCKQLAAQMTAARILTSHRRKLRGRQRRVFDLTYNELLPEAAIGQRLGISRRAAGRHLQRARRNIWLALRKQFDEQPPVT